jgi:phage terminase large subunit
MFIRFKTGSTWQVIGSDNYDALVGTPPIGVVFSEWALSDPQAWSLIRPILLENGGWSIFITTPRGRNHAHRMYEMAKGSDEWFAEHLTADKTGVFSQQQLTNEGRTDRRARRDGRRCDLRAGVHVLVVCGAARRVLRQGGRQAGDRRRHRAVPYNPAKQVHTAWDLGANDMTVIWFMQRTHGGWAAIDYIANTTTGIDWYVRELKARPYIYGEHLLPHDGDRQQLGLPEAASIADTVARWVCRTSASCRGPRAWRTTSTRCARFSPTCAFDAEKCAHGIDALRSYRRIWDEKLKAYRDNPLHDWASDPADAFRTFAIGKPQEIGANDDFEEEWRDEAGRNSATGY